jgi:DNA replication licensing factor MCM2
MLSRSQRIAEEIYVRIEGLPKNPSSGHIRDIRNEHLNQLINISGVVTRCSGVFPQLKISWFDCLACMSTFGPFVQNQEKEFRLNRCPQCQSKGGFQVNAERTIYQNYQKVTLQEAPGTVPPGRLPRHKDVALLGDLIDKVRPGQKIEVTGNFCSTAARAWRCRALTSSQESTLTGSTRLSV